MSSYIWIWPKKLFRLIGTRGAPAVSDAEFDADPSLIPVARRHSHCDVYDRASGLSGQSIGVTCHKGQKLSKGEPLGWSDRGEFCTSDVTMTEVGPSRPQWAHRAAIARPADTPRLIS